ncbi:MAG: iron-containing alcohol dehydrogenase [Planctomycetota bacterium]|nr:iron-containing alcohol dehydrogenase [Planctomycetota bacterium]
MPNDSSPSAMKDRARQLLTQWRGDRYVFGLGCFARLGELAVALGRRASVVASGVGKPWGPPIHDAARASLAAAGVELAGDLIPGAANNSPREDVSRIAESLAAQRPDLVISIGGGSNIDAAKAAAAYHVLGDKYPDIDSWFGLGQVTAMLRTTGRRMMPLLVAQLASASGSHLTKYANITDMRTHQKMLIIDDALVPPRALFDYRLTVTMPPDFTMDGAMDGHAHCFEVLMGIPAAKFAEAARVAVLGIDLIVSNLKAVLRSPEDLEAREALGLATDLGGYAIMIGGTSGGHLTSFSLVDILPHGRAVALMNQYYAVFFAPAIEDRLRAVGEIYRKAGYVTADLDRLGGRSLGQAVADGMIALACSIGYPTTLAEVPGFTDAHIDRALAAAKDPKLASKLQNMPVPMTAETVDHYMRPILEAARTGRFELIRNMA